MPQNEVDQIRNKIFKGLKLARKRAVAEAIAHNTPLVTSENGKIKLIKPSELS